FRLTGHRRRTTPSPHPAGNPRARESQAGRLNRRREPQPPRRCRSRTPPKIQTRGAQTACLRRSSSLLGKIAPYKRSFYRIQPHQAGYYLGVVFPKFIRPSPKPLDAGRDGWSSIARAKRRIDGVFTQDGEDMEADPILF